MKQVVQSTGHGVLRVVEVPVPSIDPTEVLVATRRSLLSSGTERAVRELASGSLLKKARARPDLVRQVISKARTDGVKATVHAVRSRLSDETPLGYSAAGVVVQSGENSPGLPPGTRVATASAGHAEMQVVPGMLAVRIPDGVSDEAAAFGAVAAIALQGIRQSGVGPGGTVVVVGLGLVGQLTTRLAIASGLRVIGIDLRTWTAELAALSGAHGLTEMGSDTTEAVLALTKGRGADAAIVTASTSSSDPVMAACSRIRDRGCIVIVGDVGLELARAPFYLKEIEIRFARSYGPGRYDPSYEGLAVDYPIGHVRWTEARNIEAYLDFVADGRMKVDDLITHVFGIDEAETAYHTISEDPQALAVQFRYELDVNTSRASIHLQARKTPSPLDSGLIGAGDFAKNVLLPSMQKSGWPSPVAVTSSKGLSARHLAERFRIETVAGDVDALLAAPSVSNVFVLSRHDTHADLVVRALNADVNVFVEKPLALTEMELTRVIDCVNSSSSLLWVGFNRRYSEAVEKTRDVLQGSGTSPVIISYRVSAGLVPDGHWYGDRRQGGRLLGEVCHFVDTASWILREAPARVYAVGSGGTETLLQDDYAVTVSYPSGSIATITYDSGGHSSTSKERIEVLGHKHTVTIDDFQSLHIDGVPTKLARPGRGHIENLKQFREGVLSRLDPTEHVRMSIDTSATMLAAVQSLMSGASERVISMPAHNALSSTTQ